MRHIVRRDPFFPMINFLEEILGNRENELVSSEEERSRAMALDVMETDKEYRVLANLPGLKKEDVKISLEQRQLTIETAVQKEEENVNFYYRERYYGKYRRVITLPGNVDANSIKAKMENGLLEIVIPKEDKKPQTLISID